MADDADKPWLSIDYLNLPAIPKAVWQPALAQLKRAKGRVLGRCLSDERMAEARKTPRRKKR